MANLVLRSIDLYRQFARLILMLECLASSSEPVMSLLIRSCAVLLLTLSLPLAAAPAPMHAQFLPPDDLTLRDAEPEQQQLLQVTEYSVVVGSQCQSNQQPIPRTAPIMIRLKGKS